MPLDEGEGRKTQINFHVPVKTGDSLVNCLLDPLRGRPCIYRVWVLVIQDLE